MRSAITCSVSNRRSAATVRPWFQPAPYTRDSGAAALLSVPDRQVEGDADDDRLSRTRAAPREDAIYSDSRLRLTVATGILQIFFTSQSAGIDYVSGGDSVNERVTFYHRGGGNYRPEERRIVVAA